MKSLLPILAFFAGCHLNTKPSPLGAAKTNYSLSELRQLEALPLDKSKIQAHVRAINKIPKNDPENSTGRSPGEFRHTLFPKDTVLIATPDCPFVILDNHHHDIVPFFFYISCGIKPANDRTINDIFFIAIVPSEKPDDPSRLRFDASNKVYETPFELRKLLSKPAIGSRAIGKFVQFSEHGDNFFTIIDFKPL